MALGDSIAMKTRHQTVAVKVGGVTVGGGAPVVVQSMTNTDTADIQSTVNQVADLARAGSELVRITVDRDEAAKAVPFIRDAAAQARRGRAADRRFPLHRAQAFGRQSRPAPKRSTSIVSTPATLASKTRKIASSAPSSKRRCAMASPSGSASIGVRSIASS